MSNVNITKVSRAVDVRVMASADQETILGNGTTQDPLRAASGVTNTFRAVFVNAPPRLGIFATPVSPFNGTRVAAGDARAVGGVGSKIVGVVVEIDILNVFEATTQTGGLVELSEADWDVVTDGTGGLERGVPYYLATPPTQSGHITTTPPAGSEEFVVQVGIALNPRTMLLSTPSIRFRNP